ncbi:amidohydrolase [Putridiphycobacter roseus]|uniref:Amidohydrolase n=2 Tax=Putridiphycobacter roseus TaxID=2219161 RepID=A0A2W1NRI1_9FLAO|nr:amidohydrolase [Putridiphycobacter roseus]
MQSSLQAILPALTKIRRQLHAHPEVALTEIKTTQTIIAYLEKHCHGKITTFEPSGVMVEFDSDVPGESTMIRGDIDALPIQEINDFEYQSKFKNVSHKCGHDGHTAILLGLANLLSQTPIEKGKVCLVFQPAEENGKGAALVLENDHFNTLTFDYVYALHNLPGFPLHQIVIKENNFNANVKTLIIDFNGKTAHAAEPEKGHNPFLAIAKTLLFCESITLNEPSKANFFLITPAYSNIGQKAYGISPSEGTLHLTIRSWDLELFDHKIAALKNKINELCKFYHLKVDYHWTEVFFANINDMEATNRIRQAANENKQDVHELAVPFKWGEDFGLFTQKFKGAMFGLGAGLDSPALHNPDYDFPDEITHTGIQTFYKIIQNSHHK